jgi:(E)-4-hydroxy-3-methylbut-2-enyl-diphosphate synthase
MYCDSLVTYQRRKTVSVKIGDLMLGSDYPIRVQSMTTIDTMDTLGSVEQSIRMIESGCELIRITAPSVKEAQNLENIKKELRRRGYSTPLVADIHFTPNAAELAARIVEKVRINPGNYADKKRFETIDYTEAAYEAELQRIHERFLPLIKICKENGTAMRIGTNHGSLSDRIMSRYGDNPLGMVESALEFIKICEDENYFNLVISMKSSNPQVMVQAYRLLVKRLNEEQLQPYPLHLGVTEAGEGEDGRIKSAMGIGTLLEDGLGDTVRVSLTEEPEHEAPVAKALIDRYLDKKNTNFQPIENYPINPYQYKRRTTTEVQNLGGNQVPRVIADYSAIKIENVDDLKAIGHFYLPLLDKWHMNDVGADYIYSGKNKIPFMLPNGLKEIVDFAYWNKSDTTFPLLSSSTFLETNEFHPSLNFLEIKLSEFSVVIQEKLKLHPNFALVLSPETEDNYLEIRRLTVELINNSILNPIVFRGNYSAQTPEDFQLFASTDCGGLLIDGLGDGLFFNLNTNENWLQRAKTNNTTAFGILQAARTRITKTEYISCPSCGRTLFDLQETTALIRKRTDHLKGIKIGIMGCIVNGPGEMADADYGYVGMGKNKIALYRGQEVVKRSVNSDNAVDELITLIKEDGCWLEPNENAQMV